MSEGLVFDLDDTLYLERDYVRSGFGHIASHVATSVGLPQGEVRDFLWAGFESGERGRAFDRLIEEFPDVGRSETVSSLVEIYRSHQPFIGLIEPSVVAGLAHSGVRLALISDGYPTSQRAKIDALGLGDLFELVILTDEWGVEYRKPHHRAFEEVEEAFSLGGRDLLYIADNPRKDFIAPNRRGWLSVRIRVPGQLHEFVEPADRSAAPRHEIDSLGKLADLWSQTDSWRHDNLR